MMTAIAASSPAGKVKAPVPLCTALLVAAGGFFATPAAAQDMLRGSYVTTPQYYQWDGFYGGGQVNYNIASFNLSKATAPLTSFILRSSTIEDNVAGLSTLKNGSTTGTGFGGFIGYNWQWDDVVVGVEANYSRTSLKKSAADSISRSFIDNGAAPPNHTYTYNVTVVGNTAISLTDLATFRARAGWAVGSLLPYGFVGFAVGRADVKSYAGVSGTLQDSDNNTGATTPPVPLLLDGPQSLDRKGVFAYGGSVGLGFDWALTQNLFVRGEYEYLQLQKIEGIDVRLNTVRAAVGLKF